MNKAIRTRAVRLDEWYTFLREEPELEHLRIGSRFVPGKGSTRPLIMFVADVPTEEESKAGKALVGRELVVLREMLAAVDLKTEHVFYTHCLKYRPSKGRDPRDGEMTVSMPILYEEAAILKPKVIMPLGRFATSVYFPDHSFNKVRGKQTVDEDFSYVPTVSFGAVLHNPALRKDMLSDMQRAAELL